MDKYVDPNDKRRMKMEGYKRDLLLESQLRVSSQYYTEFSISLLLIFFLCYSLTNWSILLSSSI